jgi:hypothetical protein
MELPTHFMSQPSAEGSSCFALRKKITEDATRRDRTGGAASKGNHMTIKFEKLKARLLANPKVKAEYDALAPEFEHRRPDASANMAG